jgi:hypothetical protein
MLRELRGRLLFGLPEMMPPPGDAEHVEDVSVVKQGGAVVAPGPPVNDAAVRTLDGVKPVVDEVIYLGAAGGAAHVEVVARLRDPRLRCQTGRAPLPVDAALVLELLGRWPTWQTVDRRQQATVDWAPDLDSLQPGTDGGGASAPASSSRR